MRRDGCELGLPHSCLLAKKALAFKSISFSSLSLAFSLRSVLSSSSVWKGFPACAVAPSALLTQLATLLGSTPISRPIDANVAPSVER